MNRKQTSSKLIWVADPQNKKYSQVKSNFFNALQEQATEDKIGYYDFLLVAKRLSFKFQESSHLMALKNYFSKNKNLMPSRNLCDILFISENSLSSKKEQKFIVKFNVPDVQFAPIKQETLQDQGYDEERSMKAFQQLQQDGPFLKIGNEIDRQRERQLTQKMGIILSIKVEEMQKKMLILTIASAQDYSLLTYFNSFQQQKITYEQFRSGMLDIISNNKQKIKVSQDDAKTIFYLLDDQKKGYLTVKDISKLQSLQRSGLVEKMKDFYGVRLNKDMVRNTLFKLGRVKNNSIQIYQLKSPSLMQFEEMQEAIVGYHGGSSRNKFQIRRNKDLNKQKRRIPHFGPLKGAAKQRNNPQMTQSHPHYNHTYASTHPHKPNVNIFSINKEREKIERILRLSKNTKQFGRQSEKNGQTIASKLRSLFIHKVILPREKMLQQQKEKLSRSKLPQHHQLSFKTLK